MSSGSPWRRLRPAPSRPGLPGRWRDIRERGGKHAGSPIYVVAPDPGVFPAEWRKELNIDILPLAMDPAFMDYPLALKAFAAAQVEQTAKDKVDTLIWLDPGVIVFKALEDLDLKKEFDAVVRPGHPGQHHRHPAAWRAE